MIFLWAENQLKDGYGPETTVIIKKMEQIIEDEEDPDTLP
jgi:hypothetical protein